MDEFGIHARASCRQRLQHIWCFEGAVDQHAAGGVGGFAAGFSTLDDEDRGAALAEGDGERQADDASADDDYVPSLHRGIVKERGRERSVSDVACTALPVQAREPSLRLKKRTPPRMTPIGGRDRANVGMTGSSRVHKMGRMKKIFFAGVVMAVLATASAAWGQHDKGVEPTSFIYFAVVKDENGKPVRNAAVIMHEVNPKGKQERGGMELKTDLEGKANFDGVPYGMLRVQVLAQGFQTYGEDYDIEKDKTEITIKLKRPQGQYSVYDDHPNAPPKQDGPPPDPNKKPN